MEITSDSKQKEEETSNENLKKDSEEKQGNNTDENFNKTASKKDIIAKWQNENPFKSPAECNSEIAYKEVIKNFLSGREKAEIIKVYIDNSNIKSLNSSKTRSEKAIIKWQLQNPAGRKITCSKELHYLYSSVPYSPWQNGVVERHRIDNKQFYSKRCFRSEKEMYKAFNRYAVQC